MTREDIVNMIDFSNQEYNEKVAKLDNTFLFEEFIDSIINIVKENNGTLEDAVFVANDAYIHL